MPFVRMLYNFGPHRQGDLVEVNEIEARVLTAIDAIGGRRAVPVEPHTVTIDEPRRGRYARRDLRAKDE